MYLTAQRVQSALGHEDVHAFLHFHDHPACPFPYEAPLTVPQQMPGRLALASPQLLHPGGNAVAAYLDVIAPDQAWPWAAAWMAQLPGIAAVWMQTPVPWVVAVGPSFVVFNTTPRPGVQVAGEYAVLLQAGLNLSTAYAAAALGA